MQHQHATSTCNINMQINMQHQHATSTCNINMQNQHATSTCNININMQHATSTTHQGGLRGDLALLEGLVEVLEERLLEEAVAGVARVVVRGRGVARGMGVVRRVARGMKKEMVKKKKRRMMGASRTDTTRLKGDWSFCSHAFSTTTASRTGILQETLPVLHSTGTFVELHGLSSHSGVSDSNFSSSLNLFWIQLLAGNRSPAEHSSFNHFSECNLFGKLPSVTSRNETLFSMQYNTIQYKAIQYNTRQYNTMQYNKIK